MQMKPKNLGDALTYSYIKRIKKWMECPVCHKKMFFSKRQKSWVCAECSYSITEENFLDDFVFWFCDGCNTYLNVQPGFDPKGATWFCSKCGFENDITFANIKGECKDCGVVLDDPAASICSECKVNRMQKVKNVLDATADFCYVLSNAVKSDDSEYSGIVCDSIYDDGDEEQFEMKCANCGNTDTNTLWDEDDTIHCSICHHRTLKATGEDDVVECPCCHRMRDRKAMYCRYCNDSTWEPSTDEEFAEIDRDLKESGY